METMVDEEKIEKILLGITKLSNDMEHLKTRMDSKSGEIKEINERLNGFEVRLALNDQKTNRNNDWFDYVFKGIITVLAGYVAIKIGLK